MIPPLAREYFFYGRTYFLELLFVKRSKGNARCTPHYGADVIMQTLIFPQETSYGISNSDRESFIFKQSLQQKST
jgi:hypothetical protein